MLSTFAILTFTLTTAPEHLTYKIRYLGIPAGHVEVTKTETFVKGQPVIAYDVLADSSGIGAIFPVHDHLTSFVDSKGQYKGFHLVADEAFSKREERTVVDAGVATVQRRSGAGGGVGSVVKVLTPANVQDALTAMYALRDHVLNAGDKFPLNLLMGKNLQTYWVSVGPGASPGTVQIHIQGMSDATVTMTNDAAHVPVKIELESVLGKFNADLTERR